VVEAFGTIDALYPGRIDLGLGRSGQRRAEAGVGNGQPAEPGEPTVVEGTLFPKPFRLTPLILSERFAVAGAVLQQPGVQVPDFEALTPEQAALVEDRVATRFVGTSATVAEKLDGLQRANGAKELLVTTITYDHHDRLRSHELLAMEWRSR
jgi:alkanesulfonate monooxygenase SsuD/methylene tetrahydromethanopterin reductase-like flavin-dependent oxidoreductase (luciferase family)